MNQISRKNSFGKVVFPFLVENFLSRDRNWFFSPPFCNCISYFSIFLLYFGSFGLLYQWPAFHRQIHSGKYFPELGSIGTPPLTTNGSAEGLDHLSVKLVMYENKPFSTKIKLFYVKLDYFYKNYVILPCNSTHVQKLMLRVPNLCSLTQITYKKTCYKPLMY